MAEDRIPVSNDEIVTPRDFRRSFPAFLERLQSGELDKLVLMKGSEMVAVVVSVDDYADLRNGGDQ